LAGSPETLAKDYLEIGDSLVHNPDRAAKVFGEYTVLRPNDPLGYFKLGEALNNLGDWDSAASNFAKANDLMGAMSDSDKMAQWYKRTQGYLDKDWGYALIGQHKYDEAIAKFGQAATLLSQVGEDTGAAKAGLQDARNRKMGGQ
jgi:tetratricopeptide (TPR) repeat protein